MKLDTSPVAPSKRDHDHTELEVPDEDAMEFFSKAAGARQGQVGRKPTLVIG